MMAGKIQLDPDLSDNVQDLICSILKVDPDERITLQEIRSHPWSIEMIDKRIRTL